MPQEDGATDLSEMQPQLDPVQVDSAEGMPELQDTVMGYPTEEMNPEDIKYRVMVSDFGCTKNDILYMEYFDNYEDAFAVYGDVCDDKAFIEHHDRKMVLVILSRAYRGFAQIFWEDICQSPLYKD